MARFEEEIENSYSGLLLQRILTLDAASRVPGVTFGLGDMTVEEFEGLQLLIAERKRFTGEDKDG